MSFYNPLQSKPDWGQGISDIVNQITQIMLMKKMFPQQQGQGQGATPIPQQPNLGGATMGQMNQGMGQMPGMSQLGQGQGMGASGAMGGQDPAMLMNLLRMLGILK